MIYVASPYSHRDAGVQHERYRLVRDYVAQGITHGLHMFSPILYGHPLAVECSLPPDANWWKNFNESMMRAADSMWVLKLEGWEDSVGVKMEMTYASRIQLPFYLIDEIDVVEKVRGSNNPNS